MQKPHWCIEMGDDISDDCSEEINNDNKYFLINTNFINPRVGFIASFSLMYFLLFMQVMKV